MGSLVLMKIVQSYHELISSVTGPNPPLRSSAITIKIAHALHTVAQAERDNTKAAIGHASWSRYELPPVWTHPQQCAGGVARR